VPSLLFLQSTTFLPSTTRPLRIVHKSWSYPYSSDQVKTTAKRYLELCQVPLGENILPNLMESGNPLVAEAMRHYEILLLSELFFASRRRIASLLDSSYRVSWERQEIPDRPRWLKKLPETDAEVLLALSQAVLFPDFPSRIQGLESLRSNRGFTDVTKPRFHSFVEQLSKGQSHLSEEKSGLIATFDFGPGDTIVGLLVAEVPNADGATYPSIREGELYPVFLQQVQPDGHLPLRFLARRAVLLEAKLVEYRFENGLKFFTGVSERMLETPQAAVAALSEIFPKRLLRHERLLLRVLGLPGREFFESRFQARTLLPSVGKKDVNSPAGKEWDDYLTAEAARILDFRTELSCFETQQDVSEFLTRKPPKPESLDFLEFLLQVTRTCKPPLSGAPEIENFLHKSRRECEETRRYVLAQLVTGVQSSLSAKRDYEDFTKQMRTALWKELRAIFPDTERWPRVAGTAPRLVDEEGAIDTQRLAPISEFANTVIRSAFWRPHLRRHEISSRLPLRELKFLQKLIRRLHYLSLIFPTCCGTPRSLDMKGVSYSDVIWDSHVFSEAPEGKVVPAAELAPYPAILTPTFFCERGKCSWGFRPDGSKRPILSQIFEVNPTAATELARLFRRIAFWLNTLLEPSTHSHFRCRRCAGLLAPSTEDEKDYWFSCPFSKKSQGHDRKIYINWCLGRFCDSVIDSRDAVSKCDNGKWICTRCMACCRTHEEENLTRGQVWLCRVCETRISSDAKLGSNPGAETVCPKCQSKNRLHPSDSPDFDRDRLAAIVVISSWNNRLRGEASQSGPDRSE
jgi:hypothetical protein